jgi:hypothetical protein
MLCVRLMQNICFAGDGSEFRNCPSAGYGFTLQSLADALPLLLKVNLRKLRMKLRFPRLAIAVEFTREGWIFVLLSLAIGAAAVNTGNNVLYFIFSLMLGMIVVSGMTSRRLLQGLRPSIEFPDHLFAGVGNVCYVSVQNRKKRIPSLGIRFVVREKTFTSITRQFFYVPPNDHVSGYARVLFPHRGVFKLRELELQTNLPFSFFLKIRFECFPKFTSFRKK